VNGSLEFDKSIKGASEKQGKDDKAGLSKVKDLLRQSRETAFNLNDRDLDDMFNLQMATGGAQADKKTQEYCNRIKKLRD
jgi:methylthioribose-1-phosphate isomerase